MTNINRYAAMWLRARIRFVHVLIMRYMYLSPLPMFIRVYAARGYNIVIIVLKFKWR